MSAATVDFRRALEAGLAITLSKFENGLGTWAKAWGEVVQVRVVFEGEDPILLTPAEFRSLSRAQQALVNAAPSRLASDP